MVVAAMYIQSKRKRRSQTTGCEPKDPANDVSPAEAKKGQKTAAANSASPKPPASTTRVLTENPRSSNSGSAAVRKRIPTAPTTARAEKSVIPPSLLGA